MPPTRISSAADAASGVVPEAASEAVTAAPGLVSDAAGGATIAESVPLASTYAPVAGLSAASEAAPTADAALGLDLSAAPGASFTGTGLPATAASDAAGGATVAEGAPVPNFITLAPIPVTSISRVQARAADRFCCGSAASIQSRAGPIRSSSDGGGVPVSGPRRANLSSGRV